MPSSRSLALVPKWLWFKQRALGRTSDAVITLSRPSVFEWESQNQGSCKQDGGHEFRQLHPVFEEGMEGFSLRLANAGS